MSLGSLLGSDQSTSSTSTNTVNTPSWLLPTAQSENTLMQGILNQPYQQYQGQQVAGFNQDQTNSFNTVNGLQGAYQPYLNQANNIQNQVANTGLNGYSQQQLNGYMNPYTQNVINTSQQQNLQNFSQQQQQLQAQQGQIGAFGGSRSAIAQQQLQNNFNLNQNAQNAQQYSSAFGNAQNQAYLGDRTASQAGSSIANLGAQNQQLGLAGAGAQNAQGTQQQQLAQQNLNVPMAQFASQLQYPYQQLQGVQSGIQGLLQAENGSTTNSQSTTSGSPGILGDALGAASLFSGMGGMGGLGSMLGGMGGLSGGAGVLDAAGSSFGNAAMSAGGMSSFAATPFMWKDGGLVTGYDQGGLVDPFGLLRANRIQTNRIERGYKGASNPDKGARQARAMGGIGQSQYGDDNADRRDSTGFLSGGLVGAIDHFHSHMSHQSAFDEGVKHGRKAKGYKDGGLVGYAQGGQVSAPQGQQNTMNVSWFQNPTVSPMQKAQAAMQALNGGSKNPAQTAAAEDWMSDPQNQRMVQQYSSMKQSGLAGAVGYNAGGMVNSASPIPDDSGLDRPMRGSINPKVPFDNDGKGVNPDPTPSTEAERNAFQGRRGYADGGDVGTSSLADPGLWRNLGQSISGDLSDFANDKYAQDAHLGGRFLDTLDNMENSPYQDKQPGTTNFQNIGRNFSNLGTAEVRGLGHVINAPSNALQGIMDWGNSVPADSVDPIADAHKAGAQAAGLPQQSNPPPPPANQELPPDGSIKGMTSNFADPRLQANVDANGLGPAANLPTGGSMKAGKASTASLTDSSTDPNEPESGSGESYNHKAGQVNTPLVAFGAALLGSKNNFFHSLGAAGSAYVDAKNSEVTAENDAARTAAYKQQVEQSKLMAPYKVQEAQAKVAKLNMALNASGNPQAAATKTFNSPNFMILSPEEQEVIKTTMMGGISKGGTANVQTPQAAKYTPEQYKAVLQQNGLLEGGSDAAAMNPQQ